MKRRFLSMLACVILAVPPIASASTTAWSCPHSSKTVERDISQIRMSSLRCHNVAYKSNAVCMDCKAVLSTEYHVSGEPHVMQAVTGMYSANGTQTWRMICRCCGQTETKTYHGLEKLQSFTV